jgi:hypothetical protein
VQGKEYCKKWQRSLFYTKNLLASFDGINLAAFMC